MNTKTDGRTLKVERRPNFSPLKSLLRFSFFAAIVQFARGLRGFLHRKIDRLLGSGRAGRPGPQHRIRKIDKESDFSQKQTKETKKTESETLFLRSSFTSRSSVKNPGRDLPQSSVAASPRSALCVFLRQFDFGVRVKLFAAGILLRTRSRRANFLSKSSRRLPSLRARSVRLTDWVRHHILLPSPVLEYRNRRGWCRVIRRNSEKGLHYETNIALHRVGSLCAGRCSSESARVQLDGRNEGRQAGI